MFSVPRDPNADKRTRDFLQKVAQVVNDLTNRFELVRDEDGFSATATTTTYYLGQVWSRKSGYGMYGG